MLFKILVCEPPHMKRPKELTEAKLFQIFLTHIDGSSGTMTELQQLSKNFALFDHIGE